MVPLRLQLHNFLSYGDHVPPLDFAGLRMVCLSGSNGHGKSALLEAITWALWGEARKGIGAARQHQGLLRSAPGVTEMWVILDFEHEGEHYRVRRSYQTRRNKLDLDLAVWDPTIEDFRPLSLPTIAATEARIGALLRMDYDTFVNSAFLMQGRANEFTRRRPAERKQVLSEILGLSRYEALRELARGRQQRLQQQLDVDERRLAALDDSLAGAAEVADRLGTVVAALEVVSAAVEDAAAQVVSLQEQLAADQRRRDRVDERLQRLHETESDLGETRREAQKTAQEVAELTALMEQREEITARLRRLEELEAEHRHLTGALQRRRELQGEVQRLTEAVRHQEEQAASERQRLGERVQELQQRQAAAEEVLARAERVRQQVEAHQKLRDRLAAASRSESRYRALKDQLEAVERRVEKARADLSAEIRQVAERLREVRAKADEEADLGQAVLADQERLAQAERAQQAVRAGEQQLARNESEFATLKARDEHLKQRLEELQRHQAILADGGGVCPVCRQGLTALRLGEVEADYAAQRRALDDELEQVKRDGRQARDERRRLQDDVARLRDLAQTVDQARRDLARDEHRLTEAQEHGREVARLDDRLKELKAHLGSGEYGGEDQFSLRRLRRELADLDYHPEQVDEVRRALDRGREVEREQLLQEQAQEERRRVLADLPAATAQLQALAERLATGEIARDERERLSRLTVELAQLTVTDDDLARVDAARKELADVPRQWQNLEQAGQKLPGEQDKLAAQQRRLATRERALRELQRELEELRAGLLDRPAVGKLRDDLEATLQVKRQEQAALQQDQGRLQAQHAQHEGQEVERSALRASLQALRRDLEVYQHLAEAFGRDGIPALIIASAVPEIEAAADAILKRLTGGRMGLQIQLQKLLRTGDARDTLEIEISDELGVRSYENYSGGEAFRVDFALRLALSELLTRRAGARLRTLIIDEGFGTQDEDGIDQLVDAIASVADLFELVLVVTHLSGLKDRFPTRIEVHKEADLGSQFEVVHDDA